MRKIRFRRGFLLPLLMLCAFAACTFGAGLAVQWQTEDRLADSAFAAWLREDGHYLYFDDMEEARRAWSFVVYMTRHLKGRADGGKAYRDFLEKWRIAPEGVKSGGGDLLI